MPKRIQPDTSMDAYLSLDKVKITQTHLAITKALEAIGKGNYEMIAKHMGVPYQKVWKRLKEAVDAKLIHNTGEWVKTEGGYKSYMFAAGPATETVKKKERVMKGKTVSQFSKAILNQPKQSPHTIERLF